MSFNYNFSAVRGVQAGRDYYIAMIPLGLLAKLFSNEDEYLLPEHRAQRSINEARIPEIKNYILEKGTDLKYGARPLRRAIQRYIEDPISDMILRSEVLACQKIVVNLENEQLSFKTI